MVAKRVAAPLALPLALAKSLTQRLLSRFTGEMAKMIPIALPAADGIPTARHQAPAGQ